MRRTFLSRLLTAMFGVWFTFTLALPNGMSAMNMSSGSAPMNMAGMDMSGMDMAGMSGMKMDMAQMDMAKMDMSNTEVSNTEVSNTEVSNTGSADNRVASSNAEQRAPVRPATPQECDQHDCCCSAVSPTMLTPDTPLAWLPEHVINQETPQTGDCVVHTDGQLLLPFANGPPATVSA